MQILNIAGYKFIQLDDLDSLRQTMEEQCYWLKGTILLSAEGINISLAGTVEKINIFKTFLSNDLRFNDMTFRESYSETQPFQQMKVKLKNEIITMRQSDINPNIKRAPSIQPELFKQWLDEGRDVTILDTRNDYEVRFGTFTGALNLHLNNFVEFPATVTTLDNDKEKPVVMFCTGGIRCEKAALYLMNHGFKNVYQLEGGILNYFAKVGGAHYEGECYVFDERIALNADLENKGTLQCLVCQGPITSAEQLLPTYVVGKSCPRCQSN